MKTQIPIYRGKRIDSDEYVEGYMREDSERKPFKYYMQLHKGYFNANVEIDPSTLAIHFPDMIDSEGTKIFASLSKDGKGGDNVTYDWWDDGFQKSTLRYKKGCIFTIDTLEVQYDEAIFKVTGIQQ